MKPYTLLLLIAGALAMPDAIRPVAYQDGARIYAPASDVDQGYGTIIHDGITYAFQEPPAPEQWYISNAGGNDLPHWTYLPNAEVGPLNLTDKVPADTLSSVDDEVAVLDKRQQPPAWLRYYNVAGCSDFDSEDKPVTLGARCVWNRSFIAWASIRSSGRPTCRFITNYYNSGCGFDSQCGGYITQSIDLSGCSVYQLAQPRLSLWSCRGRRPAIFRRG